MGGGGGGGGQGLIYKLINCQCQILLLVGVVLSPAVATTTLPDTGPLCAGRTAVLTCSVADGVSIEWFYRDGPIGPFLSPSQPPSPNPVTEGGVQFTLTLSQNSNSLISNLGFTASPDMDDGVVRCLGESRGGAFSPDERTLQVEVIYKSVNCSGMFSM